MVAGAGKTFLTSTVVDHCVENAKDDEIVAFFYCKRDEPNRRNPNDILRSILRQLSTKVTSGDLGAIHPALIGLPEKLAASGMALHLSTCQTLLAKVMTGYRRITIIVDALDECDRETRDELMNAFNEFVRDNPSLRLFVSSRNDDDIRRHFHSRPVIEIEATDNEGDIFFFVQDELSKDSRWGNLDLRLQQEIKEVFHHKSKAMFQWAALQVRQLSRLRAWTGANIRQQLLAAPRGLKGAYDIVWNQIQDMSKTEKVIAKGALQWVLCAFEPLKTVQLSMLLLLQDDPDEIPTNSSCCEELISSVCGNLLIKDSETKVWRFSHLSAREYVEEHHFPMAEAHSSVATFCLEFLQRSSTWKVLPTPSTPSFHENYNEFDESIRMLRTFAFPGAVSDPDFPDIFESRGFQGICRFGDFRDYAISRALFHAHQADSPTFKCPKLTAGLQEFFGSVNQGGATYQTWNEVFASRVGISCKPLAAMATFGLFYLLREWWVEAVREHQGWNAYSPPILSLAIRYGHEPIWRLLVQEKADLNVGHPLPLLTAIRFNDKAAFDALLEAGADVNAVDPSIHGVIPNRLPVNHRAYGISPLECAAQYSTMMIIEVLLDKAIMIPRPEFFLYLAAGNQQADLGLLLRRLRADVNVQWQGVSLLTRAVGSGNALAVCMLLKMGASAELVSREGWKAALRAKGLDPDEGVHVVDLLAMKTSARYNSDSEASLLQITAATHHRYMEEILQLINAGVEVNQTVNDKLHPISLKLAQARSNFQIFCSLFAGGTKPF